MPVNLPPNLVPIPRPELEPGPAPAPRAAPGPALEPESPVPTTVLFFSPKLLAEQLTYMDAVSRQAMQGGQSRPPPGHQLS